jgi:DNA-directed RNA polymerase subunit RPC12/RpoP
LKKGKNEIIKKEFPKCGSLNNKNVNLCQDCGYKFLSSIKKKKTTKDK